VLETIEATPGRFKGGGERWRSDYSGFLKGGKEKEGGFRGPVDILDGRSRRKRVRGLAHLDYKEEGRKGNDQRLASC